MKTLRKLESRFGKQLVRHNELLSARVGPEELAQAYLDKEAARYQYHAELKKRFREFSAPYVGLPHLLENGQIGASVR